MFYICIFISIYNSEKIYQIFGNYNLVTNFYVGTRSTYNCEVEWYTLFIPFFIMFYIIYENYSKYTQTGKNTFLYIVIVWGLYGVSTLMNYEIKNIMYNILDLFSKNFFALYLAYILIYKTL